MEETKTPEEANKSVVNKEIVTGNITSGEENSNTVYLDVDKYWNFYNVSNPRVIIEFRDVFGGWTSITNSATNNYFVSLNIVDNGTKELDLVLFDRNFTDLQTVIGRALRSTQSDVADKNEKEPEKVEVSSGVSMQIKYFESELSNLRIRYGYGEKNIELDASRKDKYIGFHPNINSGKRNRWRELTSNNYIYNGGILSGSDKDEASNITDEGKINITDDANFTNVTQQSTLMSTETEFFITGLTTTLTETGIRYNIKAVSLETVKLSGYKLLQRYSVLKGKPLEILNAFTNSFSDFLTIIFEDEVGNKINGEELGFNYKTGEYEIIDEKKKDENIVGLTNSIESMKEYASILKDLKSCVEYSPNTIANMLPEELSVGDILYDNLKKLDLNNVNTLDNIIKVPKDTTMEIIAYITRSSSLSKLLSNNLTQDNAKAVSTMKDNMIRLTSLVSKVCFCSQSLIPYAKANNIPIADKDYELTINFTQYIKILIALVMVRIYNRKFYEESYFSEYIEELEEYGNRIDPLISEAVKLIEINNSLPIRWKAIIPEDKENDLKYKNILCPELYPSTDENKSLWDYKNNNPFYYYFGINNDKTDGWDSERNIIKYTSLSEENEKENVTFKWCGYSLVEESGNELLDIEEKFKEAFPKRNKIESLLNKSSHFYNTNMAIGNFLDSYDNYMIEKKSKVFNDGKTFIKPHSKDIYCVEKVGDNTEYKGKYKDGATVINFKDYIENCEKYKKDQKCIYDYYKDSTSFNGSGESEKMYNMANVYDYVERITNTNERNAKIEELEDTKCCFLNKSAEKDDQYEYCSYEKIKKVINRFNGETKRINFGTMIMANKIDSADITKFTLFKEDDRLVKIPFGKIEGDRSNSCFLYERKSKDKLYNVNEGGILDIEYLSYLISLAYNSVYFNMWASGETENVLKIFKAKILLGVYNEIYLEVEVESEAIVKFKESKLSYNTDPISNEFREVVRNYLKILGRSSIDDKLESLNSKFKEYDNAIYGNTGVIVELPKEASGLKEDMKNILIDNTKDISDAKEENKNSPENMSNLSDALRKKDEAGNKSLLSEYKSGDFRNLADFILQKESEGIDEIVSNNTEDYRKFNDDESVESLEEFGNYEKYFNTSSLFIDPNAVDKDYKKEGYTKEYSLSEYDNNNLLNNLWAAVNILNCASSNESKNKLKYVWKGEYIKKSIEGITKKIEGIKQKAKEKYKNLEETQQLNVGKEIEISLGGIDSLDTNVTKWKTLTSLFNEFCSKCPLLISDKEAALLKLKENEENDTQNTSVTYTDEDGVEKNKNLIEDYPRYSLTWGIADKTELDKLKDKEGKEEKEKNTVIKFFWKKPKKPLKLRKYNWGVGNAEPHCIKNISIATGNELALLHQATMYKFDENGKSNFEVLYKDKKTEDSTIIDKKAEGSTMIDDKAKLATDVIFCASDENIINGMKNVVSKGSISLLGDPSLKFYGDFQPYTYPIYLDIKLPHRDSLINEALGDKLNKIKKVSDGDTMSYEQLSGYYTICSINHSITQSGYITNIEVMKYPGSNGEKI